MSEPVLKVRNLNIDLKTTSGVVRLVDDISFELDRGEMLGVVGESGSGKSITCRALMRLLPPRISIAAGQIEIDGRDIAQLPEKELQRVRGQEVGMIFQNPSAYLDPVMSIGNQIGESLRVHEGLSKKEALQRAAECLSQVGIPDPESRIHSYPHEFSGGMRQRAMIAAGLARRPKILIADEPTTALDVTVQAQILRLLLELRDQLGLTVILVTHDLGVVAQTCDKVAVMYAGKLMETAPLGDLLERPRHPYSLGLIESQLSQTTPGELLTCIPGQPPNLASLPSGCRFAPRCARAEDICRSLEPAATTVGQNRSSACHFANEMDTP